MYDLDNFSYKNTNRTNSKFAIKPLSDEGFVKYHSKESYPRSYLNDKFPFLKNIVSEKVQEKSKMLNSSEAKSMYINNENIGLFATQAQLLVKKIEIIKNNNFNKSKFNENKKAKILPSLKNQKSKSQVFFLWERRTK